MISVDELLEKLRSLHEERRYQEMIDILDPAILEDSAHAELYFHRAIALSQSKIYQRAIDDFTTAIVLRPDFFRAWLNRGITFSQDRKYDKAVADIKKAIDLRPQNASAYRYMGDALYGKKEYDKAITYYDKTIELDPDVPESYFQRGSACMRIKEYDRAVEDFGHVLSLEPGNTSAYTSLGMALYNLKEYDAALKNFNRSISLRLVNGRAYFGLGLVYEALKEYDLASMYFKRAFYFNYDRSALIAVFKDRCPAPYIVKSLVSINDGDKKAEVDFSMMEWMIAYCAAWDRYLNELQRKGYSSAQSENYYRLLAIVNYYMGNSVAAYRIFDTKFDTDTYPYPMTLRDQYYLVLSAVDFKEPDNGLAFALEQCEKDAGNDPVDSYYAGQLYLLHDDLEKALQCFQRCGAFLPALYGKVAVYTLLENTDELMATAREIAVAESTHEAESTPRRESGLLDGIEPLTVQVDMPFESALPGIMQLVHYYELREEIAQVRILLDKDSDYRGLEFHELLKYT